MNTDKYELRLMLLTGLLSLLFIPGVLLQFIYSWFPETALADDTMHLWVLNIHNFKRASLFSIAFPIISIISFSVLSFLMYKLLPQKRWETHLARALFAIGLPLALVTFCTAFGFTWAIADLGEKLPTEPNNALSQVAAALMRGFLFSDDLATLLIAQGILFMSFEASQSGFIPEWLKWLGIIVGITVTIVIFRYLLPFLGFLTISYPAVILWFGIAGFFFYRNGMRKLSEEEN